MLISTVRTERSTVDEAANLGFLSDPKLMNTAISRAVDFVAVVGDPLALCMTGSCRKLWHDYIEACSQQGGLFPNSVTMDQINLQLQQFHSHSDTHQKDLDEVSPDEILEELARQAAGVSSSSTECPAVPFTIEIDEGYGILSVPERGSGNVGETVRKKQEEDVSSNHNFLLTLVRDHPDTFVQCKLIIVSSNNICAQFIDESVRRKMALKGVSDIVIKGRAYCERALHSDEVVVEILEYLSNKAFGRVCGVTRECISRKNLLLVCVADVNASNQGVVRPLDNSMPCFRTFARKSDLDIVKKQGFISIFSIRGDRREFCRFVKLNPDRPNNMLLEVRYLKWTRDSPYPLGVVTREIPLGTDFDSALKILAINCHIRLHFPAKVLAEVDESVRHHAVETFGTRGLKDFTDILVFTIDGEKAEDLDDAISLIVLDSETCRVGIHIVDVTCFVEKGSCIDCEAFERLETFYRDDAEDPLIPMLPHQLSTDVCSLLPDRERPVVSFWYKVNHSTGEIIDFSVCRSLVKSCKKFTYKEVNDVRNGKSSEFYDELQNLFKVTQAWGRQRGIKVVTAQQVVAELMKKVNESTVSVVMNKFPDCVPLYMNQKTVVMEPEQIYGGGTIDGDSFPVDSDDSFLLRKPIWWKIMEGVVSRRFADVKALLLDAERHSHDLWHQLDWNNDGSDKMYRCSGSIGDDTLEKPYTRITSPMRRYMDLISLRMLIAVIEDEEQSPYTREEMEHLCEHANDGLLRVNKFEHEIRVLRRAIELKNRAAVVFPYVSSFTESSVSLRFPPDICCRPDSQVLRYSGLDLVQTPEIKTLVTLNWKQRIYDLKHPNVVRNTANIGREVKLPNGNDRYYYRLPRDSWKLLVERAQYYGVLELQQTLKTIHNEFIYKQIMQKDSFNGTTITAEMLNNTCKDFREHFVCMSMCMQTGSLTQLQLTADVQNGMLQPTVQLFCLTPKLDICVEHHQEALKCFSSRFSEPASYSQYQSIDEYQRAWLPVVSMEAANSAVEEGGAIICGVCIKWWKENGQIRGRIQLEKDYCKRRQISFYPMNARYFQEDYRLLPGENKPRIFRRGPNELDYLCIRYTSSNSDELLDMCSGKFPVDEPQRRLSDEPNRRKTYAEVVKMAAPKGGVPSSHRHRTVALKSPSWVGHGITTYVSKFSRKNKPPQTGKTMMINVHFKLHQHSSDFPTMLLSKGLYLDCTVEWLPKLTPNQ